MTAKEIAEDCIRWISEDDFEYVFHPENFEMFYLKLIRERDKQWIKAISKGDKKLIKQLENESKSKK